MQDKELFKQFIAFCESQPEDKKINHFYWCNCAVGEFLSSIGVGMSKLSASWNTPEIEHVLGDSDSVLFKTVAGSWGKPQPSNYGEFTKFLKEYV